MFKFTGVLFFTVVLLVTSVIGQSRSNWDISDYYRNLPSRYKTFVGDYTPETPTFNVIADTKNGFLSLVDKAGGVEVAYLEMALFKSPGRKPLIVVTNTQDDGVCTFYETFFLRRNEGGWIDQKKTVLPALTDKMFFSASAYYRDFLRLQKKYPDTLSTLNYRFRPPRYGTRMQVTPESCAIGDVIINNPSDFQMLVRATKGFQPVYLNWAKNRGRFFLAN